MLKIEFNKKNLFINLEPAKPKPRGRSVLPDDASYRDPRQLQDGPAELPPPDVSPHHAGLQGVHTHIPPR